MGLLSGVRGARRTFRFRRAIKKKKAEEKKTTEGQVGDQGDEEENEQGKREETRKKTSLITMPNELLFCIADYLDLHDMIHVSRTCQRLHAFFPCDWKRVFELLPDDQKLETLMALAKFMPNHTVCSACFKLHVVRKGDTPRSLKTRECDIKRSRLGPGLVPRYQVRHEHVQTALKLSKSGADPKYLKKLLASHWSFRMNFLGPFCYGPVHTVHPKIVKERFLVHEKMIFLPPLVPNSFSRYGRGMRIILHEALMICPHLVRYGGSYMGPDILNHSSRNVTEALTAAYDHEGEKMHGHCDQCLTDFSIMVSRGARRLTVNIWRDCGCYASPLNWQWRSHLWTTGNNAVRAPPLPSWRTPGMVRYGYEFGYDPPELAIGVAQAGS